MRRFVPVFVVVAGALSACSGGGARVGVATLADDTDAGADSTVAGGTAEEATADTEAQMLAFAACMRDNGVDMEDPVVGADGSVDFGGFGRGPGAAGADAGDGPPEGLREAFETCGDLLEGTQLGGRRFGGDQTELSDRLVEYAQCMRDEGIDMDDPDLSNLGPGGGGGGQPGEGGGPFGDIDPSDPDFVAASEVCGEILAGFGPGGGGPGGRGAPGAATTEGEA